MRISLPDGYRIERFDSTLHDCSGFCCEEPRLDNFLKNNALSDQRLELSSTHVLLHGTESDSLVVGYVTTIPTRVPLSDLAAPFKGKRKPEFVYGLLLAKLAVTASYKGRKLGELLLKYAMELALDLSEIAGCTALFVDILSEGVKPFYVKYGFLQCGDNPLRVLLPISTIREAFALR